MDFDGYSDVVNAWVNEVLNNRGYNAERTLKFCSDIKQYALEKNDAKLLGFAYYYSGETYYGLNDGENLFRNITKAISYLDQSEQWELVARAYNIMAITSLNRGNAPIAMDYYLTGLNYCKKYSLYTAENIININLGNLYLSTGQYNEAQKYFEKASRYIANEQNSESYYSVLTCIYTSLGTSFMLRGMDEKAQEYVEKLDDECWEHICKTEKLYVLCFKARFYHQMGRMSRRDECIKYVHANTDVDMAVMDIFDDFYEFCRLLLETGFDKEFWDVLGILEELVRHAKIMNLQKRIISLKIKYYRFHKDNAGYLQAAGLYYEFSEIMEQENQYMITNMLRVRSSLERANEKRREMEAVNERLQEKSETDALTHLANRFRLNDYSETAFERALNNGTSLAVEIMDIDYFKQYNDNYGHQAGDECIVSIATLLSKMQNESIFCARYGGDEFIIIYEGMTKAEVYQQAEQLRRSIMDMAMEHKYSLAVPFVTVSQGICFDTPKEDTKNWDFLHAADMLLYHVKKKSRNDISIGNLNEGCKKG